MYQKNNQINLEALSEAYLGLARISLIENDLDNFTVFAQKSEEISLKHNFFSLYKRILQLRLLAIYKTGEYDQLPSQFQVYLEKEDSVEKALLDDKSYILEKAIQGAKDQAELNFIKKEQVLNRSTIANQKTGIIIISSLFFVLVLLFIWTYSLLLQKKRLVNALDEANNEKIKVFSIVAHDFKSPINTLKGFSELLANNFEMLSKEEIKSTASDIKKSLGNTLKMSENLLTWAKNQLHELSINPEKFDVKDLIEEVVSYSYNSIEDKNINVIQNYDHNCHAYADRNQIEVVIRNLIGNAIKFSPINGEISIKALCVDDQVLISISDQGNGIPHDISNDLFKISVNSMKGTSGEKGSGLGLILSHDFVVANEGKIWFNNNSDKGVTFSIELPSSISKQYS